MQFFSCKTIFYSILKQTQEYTLLMWALAFYLMENIDEIHFELNFVESVLQAALNQLLDAETTTHIHNAVLKVRRTVQ